MEANDSFYTLFPSPIGIIRLISFRGRLTHLLFQRTEKRLLAHVLTQIKAKSGSLPIEDTSLFQYWHNLLERYFCGERVIFNEPVDLMQGEDRALPVRARGDRRLRGVGAIGAKRPSERMRARGGGSIGFAYGGGDASPCNGSL